MNLGDLGDRSWWTTVSITLAGALIGALLTALVASLTVIAWWGYSPLDSSGWPLASVCAIPVALTTYPLFAGLALRLTHRSWWAWTIPALYVDILGSAALSAASVVTVLGSLNLAMPMAFVILLAGSSVGSVGLIHVLVARFDPVADPVNSDDRPVSNDLGFLTDWADREA